MNLSSKKNSIIILSIFFVVFLGAGGYLLWRVNQPETVAPEDSMAAPDSRDGGFTHFPCDGVVVDLPHIELKGYKVGQFVCGEGCMASESLAKTCPPTRIFTINEGSIFPEGIYEIKGLVGRGHKEQVQKYEDFQISINNSSYDKPKDAEGESNKEYYETPQGLGQYFIKEGLNTVVMSHMHKCPPKTDPNSVHLYKLCLKELNICEKGKWRKDPSGSHEYGALENPIVIEVSDSDGVGKVRTATLNGNDLPPCTTEVADGISKSSTGVSCYYIDKSSANSDDIVILLDPGRKNISAGEYNLSVSWEDGIGIGGSNCSISTSFSINDIPTDPNCGTLVGNYPTTVETWPEGTFCATGEPEPSNPVFPSLGGETSWICKDNGESVECIATRDDLKKPAPDPAPDPESDPEPDAEPDLEPETAPPGPSSPSASTPGVPSTVEKMPETGIFDNVRSSILIGSVLLFLGVTWSSLERLYRKVMISIVDARDVSRKKKFEKRVGERI